MSFYRTVVTAVAALGLATAVFAADENAAPAQVADTAAPAVAAADANAEVVKAQQVNINTATVKELKKVKGLNRQQIAAIISYRKVHEFKSLDELKDVKAFKKLNDAKLKAIEDQLTV